MKHIIPEGPHYRYQADLWELDKNIAEKLDYKYILEIKDCFSKFLMCYPLKNKNAESILNYIKNFFITFGPPKIIQTDNGTEFNNLVSKIYYEEINVKHINTSVHYPESNGQVESQHKTLQKAINIGLEDKGDEFNLLECINDTLYHYNYIKEHTTTKFIPNDIRDINDPLIIEKVKKNILDRYKNFHVEDDKKLNKDDIKYLLVDDGHINSKNNIIYGPKTKKKTYSVPVEIISNNSGGLIKIKIIGKNPYYNINKEFRVNYKLLSECSLTVWNKLLDK